MDELLLKRRSSPQTQPPPFKTPSSGEMTHENHMTLVDGLSSSFQTITPVTAISNRMRNMFEPPSPSLNPSSSSMLTPSMLSSETLNVRMRDIFAHTERMRNIFASAKLAQNSQRQKRQHSRKQNRKGTNNVKLRISSTSSRPSISSSSSCLFILFLSSSLLLSSSLSYAR